MAEDEVSEIEPSEKVSTVLVGAGVAAGVIFGIYKKSGFLGTFGYVILFGLSGLAIATLANKYTIQ
jgi:hypothetical protein